MNILKKFIMLLFSLLIVTAIFSISGCGSDNSTNSHIYDKAKIEDQMNGLGNKKIGKISVIKINSTDITQENLEDWYFNYVLKHVETNGHTVEGDKYAYCLIIYKDKPDMGIAYNGVLSKDVQIKKDKSGYSIGNNGQILIPTDENHLKEFKVEKKN